MCWLMARGGWQQTVIKYQTTSAVMEASMAWFYASGVVFAVLAGMILVYELFRLLSGRLRDEDLVAIAESDDMPTGEQA
jgi:TRAP-type transport system small permease protein